MARHFSWVQPFTTLSMSMGAGDHEVVTTVLGYADLLPEFVIKQKVVGVLSSGYVAGPRPPSHLAEAWDDRGPMPNHSPAMAAISDVWATLHM